MIIIQHGIVKIIRKLYKRVPYEVPNKQQIYNDLVAFLDKFNKLGLYKHFHRERPE